MKLFGFCEVFVSLQSLLYFSQLASGYFCPTYVKIPMKRV